ncbi:MAG: hypothetical protein R2874_01590 [Desulfobacterales bacterium]
MGNHPAGAVLPGPVTLFPRIDMKKTKPDTHKTQPVNKNQQK